MRWRSATKKEWIKMKSHKIHTMYRANWKQEPYEDWCVTCVKCQQNYILYLILYSKAFTLSSKIMFYSHAIKHVVNTWNLHPWKKAVRKREREEEEIFVFIEGSNLGTINCEYQALENLIAT